MSRDIGRIPIISLSGCKYLTNIITELPLPKSTDVPVKCHSLLNDQKIAQEAYRCINCQNEVLVNTLIIAVNSAINDVQLNDSSLDCGAAFPTCPTLLQAILKTKPHILSGRASRDVSDLSEVFSTNSLSTTEEPVVSRIKTIDKQKIKKLKDRNITYNAFCVAPLKISIKKTCTFEARKNSRHGKTTGDTPVIFDLKTEDFRDKTVKYLANTTPNIVDARNPCGDSSSKAQNSTSESQNDPSYFNISKASKDCTEIKDSSKLISLTASVSIGSTMNTAQDQGDNVLSNFPANNLIDEASKMEVTPVLHTQSPCKASQSCAGYSISSKCSDLSFESSRYDTNSFQPRRVSDPAWSQIFHSVALFHTYQSTCEPNIGVDKDGGGLFDDWVDAPKPSGSSSIPVPTVANRRVPSGCTSQTFCISSTPVAPKEKLPVFVGDELLRNLSGSPFSELSISSYQTTPGKNILVSCQNATSTLTVPTSSIAVSVSVYSGYTQVNKPSPTRLFDSDEILFTNLSNCGTLDEQMTSTPHGLAAYLPRSNQRPHSSATVSVFSSEDAPLTSVNSRSSKSAFSPVVDCLDLSSVCPFEMSVRTPGLSETIGFSCNNTQTIRSDPRKNVRGRFPSGKPRGGGGGRRRRTELEELRRWSVIDHANPDVEPKNANLCEVRYSSQNPSTNRDFTTTFDISESFQPVISKKDSSSLRYSNVCNQYGGFTEALVERVKRRRQQLKMNSEDSKVPSYNETLRSSCEIFPLSTPFPGRSQSTVTSAARMHKSPTILKSESKKGIRRSTVKIKRKSQTKEDRIDVVTSKYTTQIQSTDSECCLSPDSIVLAPVNFHLPYISSFPPVDIIRQSPPVLYQKVVSSGNCHSDETSLFSGLSIRDTNSLNVAPSSNNITSVSALSQVNDQDSHFSDVNRTHGRLLWKDIKRTLKDDYCESVTVQSFRSHSTQKSWCRSNDLSTYLPPLLPLSHYSPTLLHIPSSIDLLGKARSQDHIECSLIATNSLQPCPVNPNHFSEKSSKKDIVSLTRHSFDNLNAEVSANPIICSSEHSYSVNDGTCNIIPKLMNSYSCGIHPSNLIDGNIVLLNRNEYEISNMRELSSCSSSSSNSTNSICCITSSSPRLFSVVDAVYGSAHRCYTPSTIAYTHSSAVEDNDEDSLGITSCCQHDTSFDVDSNPNSSEIKSYSGTIELDIQKADDFGSFSPSPLSPLTDKVASIFPDEHEIKYSYQSNCSSSIVLHQFTKRLSKILRRVEELDLLQLAAVIQNKLDDVYKRVFSDQEDSDESCAYNDVSSTLPNSARLTKLEILSLCSDSAKIRSAGFMSTIPTGRLVRFLTLLLVNMQEAASVSPNISNFAVSPENSTKRHMDCQEQNKSSNKFSTQNGYFAETYVWSNPEWSSSLIGLDCARTALNIIVGPDVPRPLLMGDLIESIVSVVKHQLGCLIQNIMRVASHASQCYQPTVSLRFSTLGHIGYRITHIMILLVNLLRLHPKRFTDNFVINLTSLGMAIHSYSLTSGISLTDEWKRFILSPQEPLDLIIRAENLSEFIDSSSKTLGTLFVVGWPDHLQRSSLAILGTLYGQYEAHRKMIVNEIFRTFLSGLDVKQKSTSSTSSETEKVTYTSDRRTAKTFRLLSSSYFYDEYYGVKSKTNESYPIKSESPQYLYIHTLSALFLCITQGLIHTPNLSFPAFNCSYPSIHRYTSSSMSTRIQSSFIPEALVVKNAQFIKDEKYVLSSYRTAVRHAHYLLSGLFKRISIHAEYDIRSVLETVTNDLLTVTFHAPIEWPASAVLLNVLSSLLVQQLNETCQDVKNSTNLVASRSRNTELCGKLVAVDTLTLLIVGLNRGAKIYNLNLPSSSSIQIKNHSDSEEVKDDIVNINKYQARLIGLLSSPIPLIHHWYFSFYDILQITAKNDDSNFAGICERLNLDQSMTYLPELCSKFYDFLLPTASRFHLATWLHNCNKNASVSNLGTPSENKKYHSTKSTKNELNLVKYRHRLMTELALTHFSHSASAVGFPSAKQNLPSLDVACVGSPNSSRRLPSRSCSNCNCSPSAGWGGSFLAQSISSQRFITYSHMAKLCTNMRFRLVAHAHISAVYLLGAHSILPNFDVLYGFICKLVGESSVPMRFKALHCLSSVIHDDPKLMYIYRDCAYKSVISSSPFSDVSSIVRSRLSDNSTAVREAAVDLVSRFLTLRPQFLTEYYSAIVERILDKGVSVRKRVIRFFRDLLLNDWNTFLDAANFSQHSYSLIGNRICTDICLKLIHQIHDDSSIQKLVVEAFQGLWLTPISKSHSRFSKVLDRRIISLISVTITLKPNNFDLLDTFIVQDSSSQNPHPTGSQIDLACNQIIGRLIVLIKRHIGRLVVPNPKHFSKQGYSMESQSFSVLSNMHGLMTCLHLVSHSKPNLVCPYIGFLMDLLHKISLSVPGTLTSTDLRESQMKQTSTQYLYHLINIVEILLIETAKDIKNSDSSPMEEAMLPSLPRTIFFRLQNDLLQFVHRQCRLVVDSALSCLAVLVNHVLKDQTEVICCFAQSFRLLTDLSLELREALSTKISTSTRILSKTQPSILRALYTVGLICKYFTLDYSFNRNKLALSSSNLLDEVVDTLMLFAEYASVRMHIQSSTTFSGLNNDINNNGANLSYTRSEMNDPDLCRTAISGLGFLLFRHDHLFCTGPVQLFLTRFLSTFHTLANNHLTDTSSFFQIQRMILDNLTHYLLQKKCKKTSNNRFQFTHSSHESINGPTDQVTRHSSAVAQTYLPVVLKYCILTPSTNVRYSALNLISTTLHQGLIHPSHVLSSLICLQTDSDPNIRSRASACLTEVEQEIPGSTAMRAVSGIRMSYQLQLLIHSSEFSPLIVRGAKNYKITSERKSLSPTNNSTATVLCINHSLYTMLRTNRQYRRSLIVNLLSMFDDNQEQSHCTNENESTQNRLGQLVFIADHLAHFPYAVLDEVYYAADLIERKINLVGSTILQSLYRCLLSTFQNKRLHSEGSKFSSYSVNDDRKFTETDLMDFLDKCEAYLPREYDFNTSCVYVEMMKSFDNQGSYSLPEKDLQNIFKHCESDALKRTALSSMIYSGPSCLLLMTIRKFMHDHYGVTYSKLKDYSPSGAPKFWDKPIILVGQSNFSGQLMTLSCIVQQYVMNPGWNNVSKGPPDHILLRHFLVLRRELMIHKYNAIGEQSVKWASKSSGIIPTIENEVKEDCQVKMKSGECSTALFSLSITSKHNGLNPTECLPSIKHCLEDSFSKTTDLYGKHLVNVSRDHKLVKRKSSKSSLSSLLASPNETISGIDLRNKGKYSVNFSSCFSLSKFGKKYISSRSNSSTHSGSVVLNNLRRPQEIGSVRGHCLLLKSSPDSSNKFGFHSQVDHLHFETLESDANSDSTLLANFASMNNNVAMNSKVKQSDIPNCAKQLKKHPASQSYLQENTGTFCSYYQDTGVISHSKTISYLSHSTDSQQSDSSTHTLASLPPAMINSTNASHAGKHSTVNKPSKYGCKQPDLANKHEMGYVSQHSSVSNSIHHTSRGINQKYKSSCKSTHSNTSGAQRLHLKEPQTNKRHFSECWNLEMHQTSSTTKHISPKNVQKMEMSDSSKSEEQLCYFSESSLSSASTSLSSLPTISSADGTFSLFSSSISHSQMYGKKRKFI